MVKRRWVVERTLGWLMLNRRLDHDYLLIIVALNLTSSGLCPRTVTAFGGGALGRISCANRQPLADDGQLFRAGAGSML